MTAESERFDRLPATRDGRDPAAERDADAEGPPSRDGVLAFWADRYGVSPDVFADYTFWERGSGKIWAYRGEADSPIAIEALGITFLRTRQEHWKPTTDAVQRFGRHASECVLTLDRDSARAFAAGEDQEIEWDGDWGYLIVAHELAGEVEPIGVGLYLHGELRSQVPKGRRRDL